MGAMHWVQPISEKFALASVACIKQKLLIYAKKLCEMQTGIYADLSFFDCGRDCFWLALLLFFWPNIDGDFYTFRLRCL